MSYAESNAICKPRASRDSMSFIAVMYKCRSRNRSSSLPSSACSNSNSLSKCMNHSKETWSRLIQKKSTFDKSKLIIPTLCCKLKGVFESSIYLIQMLHFLHITSPSNLTFWAFTFRLPISKHD